MGKKPDLSQETNESQTSKKKSSSKVLYSVLAAVLAVVCFIGGALVSRMTLDGEMRSLIRLKTAIQQKYYEEVTDEEFYGVIFGAINGELLDDYSWYMTADEYAETQLGAAGNQSGLGLVFLTETGTGEEQMLITRVCGNSPAEAAGIAEGDLLVGFGASETDIQESRSFESFSTFLAEYETGEKLYLKVQTGNQTRVVEIARENYVENYVFYRTQTQSYRFTGEGATELTEGGAPLASLPHDTAYIRLTQFNGAAAEEFAQAMDLFREQGKKKLVLDLRDNGGGYLHIMQTIASYFCKDTDEKKPTVAVADYGERKEYFKADGNYYDEYFDENSRICVLADNMTASASEALIGCMLDYKAITYGDICLSERSGEIKTYGKGIMQTTYPFGLINADAVKLTTARICWPLTNTCIHGRGVLPTDGALSVAEERIGDTEITAAIQALFS